MATSVVLVTAVPSNTADGKGVLTVLISPQLVNDSDPALLANWTSHIADGSVTFKLRLDGNEIPPDSPSAPALDKSRLVPELWAKVFENCPLKAKFRNAAATKDGRGNVLPRLPISDKKANLLVTRDSAVDLHRGFVTRPAGDMEALYELHKKAVANYSLYDPAGGIKTIQRTIDPAVSARLTGRILPPGQKIPEVAGGLSYSQKALNAMASIANLYDPQTDIWPHLHRLMSAARNDRADTMDPHFMKAVPPKPITEDKKDQKDEDKPVFGFQERLSTLLNMPALMEALGLVLEFSVPPAIYSGKSKIAVKVVAPSVGDALRFVSPSTLFDPVSFLPKSSGNPDFSGKTAITVDGWINPANDYHADSLQLDSAAMQIHQFSNATAFRMARNAARRNAQKQLTGATELPLWADAVGRRDDDYTYPVLPPSPHTGGLAVWQHERQRRVTEKVQRTSVDPSDTQVLTAEDLISGFAVDVSPDGRTWIHLTRRDEEYTVAETNVIGQNVERGIRTSATRRSDTANSVPNQYDIDETIFTWKKGSLVLTEPSNGSALASQSKEKLTDQPIPWQHGFTKQMRLPEKVVETGEPFVIRSPLFGTNYRVAMRPVYVTGRAPVFHESIAAKNSLQGPFLRYELLQGPQLIIETRPKISAQDQQSLLFVGSKLDKNLKASPYIPQSVRYLVPSPATPEVARRHGKSEDAIKSGSSVIPFVKGTIPASLPLMDTTEEGKYLPDPLCTGVTAILLDIAGQPVKGTTPVSLDYYGDGVDWPDYKVHAVELRPGKALELGVEDLRYAIALPFPTDNSKKIVCEVPPGVTVVLQLTPRIDPKQIFSHAFAGFFGRTVTTAKIEASDICRPTILRLTHATDLPVWSPTATLENEGSSSASGSRPFDRSATPHPRITTQYEPYTTSKISIGAEWTDKVDDLNASGPSERTSTARFLERFLPKLGDGQKPVATNRVNDFPKDISDPVQLPFSDNRYHLATVTTHGTSRFAGVFQENLRDEPPTSADAHVYDFVATAPPPVPDVEYVIPTLQWNFEKKPRRACGLSVILNRPWFASGNGEKLAVILSEDAAASQLAGDQLKKYLALPSKYQTTYPANPVEDRVSAWGTHPDWTSAAQLPGAVDRYGNGVLEVKGGEGPFVINENSTVRVISTFTPGYNGEDKQWFCNIGFSDPPVYGVLVRLLLARYQEHAKDGCHLSQIVASDFAYLGPNRSIVLTKSGTLQTTLKIQIFGTGAYAVDGTLLTSFDIRCAEIKETNSVDFNWVEGHPVAPTAKPDQSSGILWQGSLDLGLLESGAIVVREYETYRCIEDPSKTRQKLVYADAIEFGPQSR
jgi:hypothetical protein